MIESLILAAVVVAPRPAPVRVAPRPAPARVAPQPAPHETPRPAPVVVPGHISNQKCKEEKEKCK